MNSKSGVALILVIGIVITSGMAIILTQPGPGTDGTNTTTTTPTQPPPVDPYEDYEDITTLLKRCFDGEKGFAESEGENSTIESTLVAAELISRFSLQDSSELIYEINATVEYIKSRQDVGFGGFRREGDIHQSPEVTALCVSILNRLDRMDDSTRIKASTYIGAYYVGQTFDNWLSEGVLEIKTWGMIAAVELGGPRLVCDVGSISVDENVFNLGDTIPLFTDLVLYRGEFHFGPTYFDTKSLSERIMNLETFERMVEHRSERPEIVNLLVNTTNTVNELVSEYNSTTGLFSGGLSASVVRFRLLASAGSINLIFDVSNGTDRMTALRSEVANRVDLSGKRCAPGESIADVLHLSQISDILDYCESDGLIPNA